MRPGPIGFVGAVFLLLVRGILLWLVIPLGTLVWILTVQGLRASEVTLRTFLGWIDNNLMWLLVKGPFAWSFPNSPLKWVPAKDRGGVIHRIRFGDLA